MRIRYIKPDGDGRVVDLPDASARRLIASGAAEEVSADEPITQAEFDEPTGEEQTATRRTAAKKSRGR